MTRVFYRIYYHIDIPECGVEAGDLGGWLEKEENLSHDGTCAVLGNAMVYGDARVTGSMVVSDYPSNPKTEEESLPILEKINLADLQQILSRIRTEVDFKVIKALVNHDAVPYQINLIRVLAYLEVNAPDLLTPEGLRCIVECDNALDDLFPDPDELDDDPTL